MSIAVIGLRPVINALAQPCAEARDWSSDNGEDLEPEDILVLMDTLQYMARRTCNLCNLAYQ